MALTRTLGAHSTAREVPRLTRPALRGAVGGSAGGGSDGADAGDIDDTAAAVLGLHHRVGRLGKIERGYQIEADNGLGKTRRGGGCLGKRCTTGVVDQNIQPTTLSHGEIDTGLYLLYIADIAGGKKWPRDHHHWAESQVRCGHR